MRNGRRRRPGSTESDPELDAELEGRLRAAFGSMAPPEAPESLVDAASRVADSPVGRARIPIGRRSTLGWAAVVLALLAVALGSLLPAGSGPSSTGPASPPTSTVASGLASAPSPSACVESPATVHGTWWREIGGPEAFFNWDSGARPAGNRWLLIVRFDPDALTTDQLSVWADDLDSGERATAVFNSTMDPSAIYRFDAPAPDLPGGWYLFEQPLPTAGCWRLSAAIDGRVVGTAMVEIGPFDLSPSADPRLGPTPATSEATPWPPVASMAPAADDVLALAGRDGVPGMLRCGSFGPPFTFDALANPTGAETRVGPEFDALRTVTVGDPDRDGSIGLTFREVARDAQNVLFLHDRDGFGVADGGRYIAILVKRDGEAWRLGNDGDCHPMAVPSPGYGRANWALDPAIKAPGPDTSTLHLLVREEACSGGRSASGRISPAFVTWDAQELVIELFVQTLPGNNECPGVPPTPATLRLPVPLGHRTLFDAGTIGQGGAGG